MRAQLVLVCAVVALLCGGSFAADVAPFPHEPVAHYIARVTAHDNGKIEKITLTGPGIEKELDFKADTAALAKKLKELAAKHDKSKPAMLTFEIADKLLQAYVVQLIDLSIKAGFEDVSPVPIDKKDR